MYPQYVQVGTTMSDGGPIVLYTCSECFALIGEAPAGDAGRRGHTLWHVEPGAEASSS